jgi:NTP pyrophosphatase (non-canonical NTP hydrolase)
MITRDQWQEYFDDVMRHCPDHLRQDRRYALIGAAGEVGEFLDVLKKKHWHGAPVPDDKLLEEAGDVMWYVALLASQGHAVGASDAVYAYRRGAEPLQTWIGEMARKIIHELGCASNHVSAGGQWYAGRLVEMVSSVLDAHGLSMADALAFNRAKLSWRHGEGYRADHYQSPPNPWQDDGNGGWYTDLPGGLIILTMRRVGGRWDARCAGYDSLARSNGRVAILDVITELAEDSDVEVADEFLGWACDVPLPPGAGDEVAP